ncbi:MAG: serine/threonine protein kinase [Phycicoccus sp.]|nr:serine/threonine protein kinase [Phycicoccus sp.]NMM35883.1 serine/threonine protein kinase [Phycicoccus sp.]
MNPEIGATLSGRYTLTGRIAAGGMGEVWAAMDNVLGRAVAVKLLHPALSQESDFAERFRAEARHTASLHHPNIATVFDYGEDDGTAYLVMELVDGQPLSQIIADRAPLSAEETASILVQAATALEAAHQGGVVHRDIKPANILITPDGTAKLTDFGIARAIDAAPLTQTGQVLGTAQYLSPEQALGGSATASSDIYSLGVVGYEMLTGERPFDSGTAVATALAHVNQAPPPLPVTIPTGVRDVIGAALAKDPADRPTSAAVMAAALGTPGAALSPDADPTTASATAEAPTPPTPVGVVGPAPTQVMPALTRAMPTQPPLTQPPGSSRWRPRRRPAWLLTAILAAVALGVLVVFALSGGDGGTNIPVNTPTSTTPTPTTANTVVPPSVTSSVPNKPTPGKGNGKKKGK